jgi:hypothetical protein
MRARDYANSSDPLILGRRPMHSWERKKLEALRRVGRYLKRRAENIVARGGAVSVEARVELSAVDWAVSMLEETPGERVLSQALIELVGGKRRMDRGTDE